MRGGLAALALAALLTLLPGAGGLRVASAGDPARPGEGEAKGARRADAGADARFAKFVGPSDCGECHENEWKALRLSAHHRSWLELHRRPEAKRIVLALDGPRRIDKREDCASCHYTRKRVEQEAKIAVNHGGTFGTGGESYLRFNFATPRARIEEAGRRLQEAFADLQ